MPGSWEEFQRKHILNPQVDRGYDSWNRENWNIWMRGRSNFSGDRHVNSVVISSAEAILEDFHTPGAHRHNSGTNFYWSHTPYRIFYLKRTHNEVSPYSVRDLGQMFFVAGVVTDKEGRNVPVHFHRQSSVVQSTGNLNLAERDYREIT